MKIAIPENVTNSLRFKVGDLYAAGGNSSNTAFWLVVAITERGGAHLLGLNDAGEIVSTASYNAHAIESRRKVGHCPQVASMTLHVESEVLA